MFCQKLKSVLILVGMLCCIQSTISQQCANPVYVTTPGNNLQTLIANNPPGTCFYFPNGNYAFGNTIPKDDMIFEGESRSGVQINGNGFENAFHGIASGVKIRNMTLFNFNNDAGQSLQEQAPIRGSLNIWAGENDPLASNWVIDNIESHSNVASGIFIGNYFFVRNSIFRDNGVTGIGGDDVVGTSIYNNVIFNNGINQANGALVNGAGIKITKSGGQYMPIDIRNNEVYNNNRVGIWGDVACHYWEIVGNNVYDNESHGILYEISDHAIIASNTLNNNAANYSGLPGNWSIGGITVAESADVEVIYNSVSGSRGGIVVQQTYRPANSFEETYYAQFDDLTLVCSNVLVNYNTIIGASEFGIGNAGTGLGQLDANSNIRFECNTYQSPENISFYGIDGQQYTYAQWLAAGFDQCISPSNPICQRSEEPVIDGLDADWGLEKFDIDKVILGSVDSEADLDANFEISWDFSNLYIYATIVDDVLVGDSPNAWEDDGLEVYIDGGHEQSTSYDANDHHLIFKLTDPNTVYYHSAGTINPAGVEYSLSSAPGVSYVEIKIDIIDFIDTYVQEFTNIGIDLHVNDDDDGGLRETKIAWHANTDNAWNNPSLFGAVYLDRTLCYSECNEIDNSHFDSNLDGWSTWGCDAVYNDGVCEIQNIQDVDNPWNAALAYSNVPLIQGSSYALTFGIGDDSSDRSVSIKVGKGSDPWTTIFYLTISPPSNLLVFRVNFDMLEPTILDGRVEIQVGGSQDKLLVDDVRLIRLYCDSTTDCLDSMVVLDPINTSVYQANQHLSSTATIQSPMAVDFLAGDNIELDPNFNVEMGAVFLADIQSCSN